MPNYCYNSIYFDGPDGALEELLASSDSDVDFERVIPMPASLDEANTTGASESLAVMAWLMHGMDEPTVERIKDAHGDEWEMYASQMPSFMTKDDHAAEMVTDAKTKLEAMPPEQYADVYALGARVIDNLRLHGHASWYEWRIDNWGTKWNAMDVEGEGNARSFTTAWSPPLPVFSRLAELSSVPFVATWSEEQMTCCTGVFAYDGKGLVSILEAETESEHMAINVALGIVCPDAGVKHVDGWGYLDSEEYEGDKDYFDDLLSDHLGRPVTCWDDVPGDDGDLPDIADMKWKHCELVRDENGGVAHVRPCEPDAFEVPSVLR